MRVLLVDSDAESSALLKDLLVRRGHEVTVVTSAEHACEEAQRRPFPLALLEWQPPRPDGTNICQCFRTVEGAEETVVLAITTADHPQHRMDAITAGADDFVLRPFEVDLLEVRLALAEHRAAQILDRKAVEQALLQTQERYRVLVDTVPDVICSVSADDGTFTTLNPAFEKTTGWQAGDWLGKAFTGIVHPDDVTLAVEKFEQVLRGETPPPCELRIFSKSGDCLVGEFSYIPQIEDGEVIAMLGIGRDITEARRMAEELEHHDLYDTLTDLPKRKLLHELVRTAVQNARRQASTFALLIMDLDSFKEVNDTFGHQWGDVLLLEVGNRLRSALRASDTVARLGGDEFAVLLPGVDSKGAGIATRTLLQALEQPFVLNGHNIHVSGSVGIVLCPEHGDDVNTLLRRADVAMYTAKREKSGFVVYAFELDTHDASQLALVGQLRDAIAQNELVLYYQPKVHMARGIVVGVEALIRWQHPELGLLAPDRFISLAEQTDLIHNLSRWVLTTAMDQYRAWRRSDLDLQIAVNLSMRNLHDSALPESIAALLDMKGLEPGCLTLEITESSIMTNPARALETVGRLHDMGLRIAIDDFGTGYSSMEYLKRLTVHQLKIDKSFVRDMVTDDSSQAIVRATLELARNLGMEVVAEGVEDKAAWDLLSTLGCDVAQGYYLSRPVPAADLVNWIKASPFTSARAGTPAH